MQAPPRFIGMDIHRQFVTVAAVDEQQHILFDPVKVPLDTFQAWAETHLQTTDQVALEATTNAWTIYDRVRPLVAEVTVADAHKISLISRSPRKTDQHDALVLAKLLAANLLPAVWDRFANGVT
jgi:hypothetical protein